MRQRAVLRLLPPEGEHQGEDHLLPPRRLWAQDQYLGTPQAHPEAQEGLRVGQGGVPEGRRHPGQGHHRADHPGVGQNHRQALQVTHGGIRLLGSSTKLCMGGAVKSLDSCPPQKGLIPPSQEMIY